MTTQNTEEQQPQIITAPRYEALRARYSRALENRTEDQWQIIVALFANMLDGESFSIDKVYPHVAKMSGRDESLVRSTIKELLEDRIIQTQDCRLVFFEG